MFLAGCYSISSFFSYGYVYSDDYVNGYVYIYDLSILDFIDYPI